jgi:hypothetical protein
MKFIISLCHQRDSLMEHGVCHSFWQCIPLVTLCTYDPLRPSWISWSYTSHKNLLCASFKLHDHNMTLQCLLFQATWLATLSHPTGRTSSSPATRWVPSKWCAELTSSPACSLRHLYCSREGLELTDFEPDNKYICFLLLSKAPEKTTSWLNKPLFDSTHLLDFIEIGY